MKSIVKFVCNFQKKEEIFHTKSFTWKQNIAWFVGRSVRNTMIVTSFVLTGFVSAKIYNAYHPVTVFAEKDNDISDQVLAAKIEILKEAVVNDVSQCENEKQNEGKIIFDTNGVASIGLMMFQTKTIQTYEKKLYGVTMNDKDANTLALDGTKSKYLAQDVMFKTPNKAEKDWVKCGARVHADERIDLIKALEK